ncbi:MAG: hypothetical protein JOZ29_13135 [Deltaproteobacteria bacterium]|nr:hypothetical protein [Deltaproteobacteria bacterium]
MQRRERHGYSLARFLIIAGIVLLVVLIMLGRILRPLRRSSHLYVSTLFPSASGWRTTRAEPNKVRIIDEPWLPPITGRSLAGGQSGSDVKI